jgi:DUF1707 SHOCT-like domain
MSTESASASEGPARLRASDAEREEYARIVRDAVGEGRLSLNEGDERLASIYAARFRDELRPLVTDLPGDAGEEALGYGHRRRGPAARRGRPAGDQGERTHEWGGAGEPGPEGRSEWGPGWRGSGWRGPGWRGPGRRGLGRHAAFVLVVAAVLVTIWAVTASHFFWPLIPLAFLAFGLFRHACWLGWTRNWYGEHGGRAGSAGQGKTRV